MKILVTGGAGFLGRWVVKKLLEAGHAVTAFDNLSNGSLQNIEEFEKNGSFQFVKGDILEGRELENAISGCGICIHCAAQINVQESLDYPERAFRNNLLGTFNVLEQCRKGKTRLVLIGTCMVYDLSSGQPISERHATLPRSPYASSKLAAEELALSYYYGYGLPVVVLRPFNIYGPFQKTNMEGGVVSVFIRRHLDNETLDIFGNGTQTRDLLYVEDCADFVVNAAFSDKAGGEVINAGTGKDISINDLAGLIAQDPKRIVHVEHHHPQAEIQKLVCDYSKARRLLGWEPETSLEQGIRKTMEWMRRWP